MSSGMAPQTCHPENRALPESGDRRLAPVRLPSRAKQKGRGHRPFWFSEHQTADGYSSSNVGQGFNGRTRRKSS
jgi:hypothetical protein